MKTNPISLSIFFPTYNEEANIKESIERTVEVLDASARVSEYELIIVDDGSFDATPEIADQLAASYPSVIAIHHEVNRGYGAALKTGIAAATKDFVFFTDADLQFDILEIENLLLHVGDYEFIAGYRAPRRDPIMRIANAKGWNVLNRIFFGLKIRDIDCAFKLFRRELVQSLDLHSSGAMINAEILIRTTRKGTIIKEVPVSHLPRVAGSPTGAKLSVIFRALTEMVQLYLGDLGLNTQKQMLKYMAVGVINTLVDFVIYYGLTRGTTVFANDIIVARLLSYLGGTVTSYLLNRAWTFKVHGKFNLLEIVRFYSVTLVSMAVGLVVMSFLTQFLGVYDLIAFVISTVFTFAVGFTFSKAWVFIKNSSSRRVYTQ